MYKGLHSLRHEALTGSTRSPEDHFVARGRYIYLGLARTVHEISVNVYIRRTAYKPYIHINRISYTV